MTPSASIQSPLLPTSGTPDSTSLLKPAKTIRIAVSGDVLLTQLEIDLIDTPDFQRLRRVRQLGTACFVYPTALHTRFDHSLGTLAIAIRMLDSIRKNAHNNPSQRDIDDDQEILTRLYALLHDVPHVPYGHTLEDELHIFDRHDRNSERLDRFFGPESDLGRIIAAKLGEPMHERFVRIYGWHRSAASLRDDQFIHDIVSNTVCADLVDYLARDNYFCNLGFPLEYRFLNFLYLHTETNDRGEHTRRVYVRIAKRRGQQPRRDTLTDLCRILETRYLIAERVYFHHAKIAASAMIGRAVYECRQAAELSETTLYSHTDDSLIKWLAEESKAEVAHRLATRLWQRQLHKLLYKYEADAFDAAQAQDRGRDVYGTVVDCLESAQKRSEIEDRIADEVGLQRGDVLVYCPPRDMNRKLARMKVEWQGKDVEFRKIDDPLTHPRLEAVLEAHKRLWGVWLFVRSKPEPDEEQKSLVREAFDLELVTPSDQKQAKRKEYHRRLVERALLQSNRESRFGSAGEFCRRRDKVVDDMVAVAKDNDQPFATRLRTSINRHFRSARQGEKQ